MSSIAEALREAAAGLTAVSTTPRLDAELLMGQALGVSRSELLLRHMGQPVPPAFAALLARRRNAEPIAYIVGRREFYGLDLIVTPDVLVPRPDSETLIEAAREELRQRPPARILDLGAGSGALLLAALSLWPHAQGTGIDRSPAALAVARANAERLGFGNRARLIAADWTVPGWSASFPRFELVLCNPPYVEEAAELSREVRDHEPAGALFAGADGLEAYRALLPQLPRLLVDSGVAVLEIGSGQAEPVRALAAAAGLRTGLRRDLAGLPRAILVKI